MAIQELPFAHLSLSGGESATVVFTYDDTNLRLQDLIIRNPSTSPLTIQGVLTQNDVEFFRETVVAPGETIFAITGNRTLVEGTNPDTGEPQLQLPFALSVQVAPSEVA